MQRCKRCSGNVSECILHTICDKRTSDDKEYYKKRSIHSGDLQQKMKDLNKTHGSFEANAKTAFSDGDKSKHLLSLHGQH